MDKLLGLSFGAVAGFFICMSINFATAHTPCDDTGYQEQQPSCEYVQVVNPVTGKLEQEYACG